MKVIFKFGISFPFISKSLNFFLILFTIILLNSCGDDDSIEVENQAESLDYKQKMRDFVMGISAYSKDINSNFLIIPQNGQELVTVDGEEEGVPMLDYLNAIDGVGREDLFYGYHNDNEATPTFESDYMISFLDICKQHNVQVLSTDYCWDTDHVDDSYSQNANKNYTSFAAPDRELNQIPTYPSIVYHENSNDILSLSQVKNFLYLINPSNFNSKQSMISAVNNTNYDLLIMDLFFEGEPFTASEINTLKYKNNGGKRLLIAYMSIGEAENYRYYWNASWDVGSPTWIAAVNPDWAGNYKVKYWEAEWQNIIYGNEDSYLKKIVDAQFDGVYLDIIDAFEYFDN